MGVQVRTQFKSAGQVAKIITPQVRGNLQIRAVATKQAAVAFAPQSPSIYPNSGRLKRSIIVRARTADGRFARTNNPEVAAFEVIVNVPYAGFVSGGTRPHIIRSKGPWPLRNKYTGQVFGRVVWHPGTRPNNYLDRALRQGFGAR